MSSTPMVTPSEIWNNILKGNVKKDDPLWTEYLEGAAVFDARMVDELNKIVDVLLVYVALFIAVLTSFIIQTFTQFHRNPADITNDLLVAIYDQLAAQSNNTSISRVDPRSYFQQSEADNEAAVIQNALLYTSLSLSITVSVIALVAKLWLVSYNRQAFSVGSPYERAMKRQEAYSGILVWNLGGVINMLPVILLISLFLFEIYVYVSVLAVQSIIGFIIAALLNVGAMFLGFTSLGGAFVSGCPFRSVFSSVIRHIFEKLQTLSKPLRWILRGLGCLSSKRLQWMWIMLFTSFWVALIGPLITTTTAFSTGTWFSVFFFPAAIPIAYSAQQEAVHKPQKYKISHLALWMILPVSLLMILAMWFSGSNLTFILPYGAAMSGIIGACWMVIKMSKSMADTGEIDAIAWLLKTTPPQNPATMFKKAGQMTGFDSIGRHYRPRLLESLMPFLTLLISSHHAPEHHSSDIQPSSNLGEDPHLENIEIYLACLARLSDFPDSEGTFRCLWEEAMQHPKLEQPLIDKLVVFAKPQDQFQDGLRSAAIKVLNNYNLDMDGSPVRSPATVVWSVSTALRSTASLMLNVSGWNSQEEQGHPNLYRPVELELTTHLEPPHSGEIEEV